MYIFIPYFCMSHITIYSNFIFCQILNSICASNSTEHIKNMETKPRSTGPLSYIIATCDNDSDTDSNTDPLLPNLCCVTIL